MENEASLSQMVMSAQQGNKDACSAILTCCDNLVRTVARSYYIQGADAEDLLQEARVGLLKAIRDYRQSEAHGRFIPFASLCIRRQVQTAVKAALRNKHLPLNSGISLSEPIGVGEGTTVGDIIVSSAFRDFCGMLDSKELVEAIRQGFRETLSELERQVLSLYIAGFNREEIARTLNRGARSIESALYRAKNKVRAYAQQHLDRPIGGIEDRYWYWGNLRSRSFHLPNCALGPSCTNRIRLDSWSDAVVKGFSPCTICIRNDKLLAGELDSRRGLA
jgi:RNA polymerase sporulation-specific sigma factor